MRFEFAVNATGGINVVPEFEVGRLCLLEGSNGIGKTLAVRLLELATGRQPYVTAQAAWRSLRVGLGELHIRISELRNGDTLEIELTPSTWPDDPAKGLMKLGRAWHNGQTIDIRTIPSILRVTRIGGDEDIITQFQRVIAADAAAVQRQRVRLETLIDRLIKSSNVLLQDINNVPRMELDQLIAHQEQAEERLAGAVRAYEQQSAIERTLDQLSRKQTALQHLQERGPSLELQLAKIETELDKLGSDIEQLEMRHDQHLPKALREQKLLKEIEQLRSKQTSQTQQLRVTATKLNDALAELQLSNVNDIDTAQQEASAKHDELVRNRELLIAPPDLRVLIRDILVRLDTVRGRSLDTEVVANIGQRAVQVRELRSGLIRREQELDKMEQQTFLTVIDADIQSLEECMRRLARIAKLQAELVQKQETLNGIEDNLRIKTEELDTNRDAEYQRIAAELQSLRKRQLEFIGEQAKLRYAKSMLEVHGSFEELLSEIASIRNHLPGITETFEEAQVKLAACQNLLQEAREEQTRTKDALTAFERKLEDTLRLLNQGSDYAWLRAEMADLMPTMDDDRGVALNRMARIEQAIRRFERVLTTLLTRTARLQEALEQIARNPTKETFNSYWPVIIAHYENRFGKLLADPNMQHALFDKGTFTRLDLQQQMVIWENVDDEICRRPLEAFSSGERAFAYVLGSILQQQQVTSQNHLLVLDEFGAFIEVSRIERLKRFLYDEVLQVGNANAIIIILPLREQLPTTDDEQGDLSDRHTRMLVEHGYTWDEVEVST